MNDRSEAGLWRIVQVVVVVLVLGLFLFETRAVLNPVMLFALLWAVMIPFRGAPGHGALLAVSGALTLLWLLAATDTLLAPFVLSLVLAYVLDPLADRIQGRGVSRTIAVLLIMVPAIALLVVAFLVGIPLAIRELGSVLQETPVLFQRLAEWIEDSQARLVSLEIPFIDTAALARQLRSIDSAAVVAFFQERQDALASGVWTGVLGIGRGLGSVLTVLGYVALTPVLTFYLIRDVDRVSAGVTELVPVDLRETFLAFMAESDGLVSSYLRGQIMVAVVDGALIGVGLAIVGFPYAATLALVFGLFSIVPYLGLVISLVPAIVIALVSGSVGVSLLKVAGVYTVVQLLDATVISPGIVGESVGIHPVLIVLALTLGGYFFGFAGLLIAVPAAAVLKLLIIRGLERYKASDFFGGESVASS